MELRRLLSLADNMPGYRRLAAGPAEGGESRAVALEAARPYLIAALYRRWERPMLVVTAQPEQGKQLAEQLLIWTGARVRIFPEPDTLPYEQIASDITTEMERVQVLSLLAACGPESASREPPLIVASAAGLMSKTARYRDFAAHCDRLTVGMEVEPLRLMARLEATGYRIETTVEVPGTASRRGGIVDVYPPTGDLPARVEFFGNTVESIRLFDPVNQRSLQAVPAVEIGPATEMLAPFLEPREKLERALNVDLSGCKPEMKERWRRDAALFLERQRPHGGQYYASLFEQSGLLDYLPREAVLVLDGPCAITGAADSWHEEAEHLRQDKTADGDLPARFPRPYFIWEEIEAEIAGRDRLLLSDWNGEEGPVRLDFTPAPDYAGRLDRFIEGSKGLLEKGRRLIVVSHQASRLAELLAQEGIIATPQSEVRETPPPGSLTLVQGALAGGWTMNSGTALLTDAEIFGFVKQRRQVKRRPVPRQRLYVDIAPGDYVVHVEHGIGSFSEVVTLSRDGAEREYLVLRYAAGDKLYVPTDQIDRVSRYIGAGDRPPALSRLGTQEWARTKQRVREAAEELAQEMLHLYAAREVVPGYAFSTDTVWQQELEGSFPYVETPDQLQAQQEVKADMEKARPMDRLVCGDVGYGKTEVALRAAFKAVMDGKQVAVLVPTTVLAQQHFATFSERMAAFPVRIEVLSRFRTPGEQREIIEELGEGKVDICIGTHRLLQKDVVFKDLGLLVIDEEQRFGVSHKEYLKRKRREVDVLTLSATPIPRTLHMALVGVRDMSTMETPPEERLPIKTYVAEYSERLVREAIIRELERNGQVFFVHNRVQSIHMVAQRLELLVPEARIAAAHGQMSEEKLEQVMAGFARGESDVLVCTTIIESGLDMPNVNTLIVNRADKFGLTQLYQLRGRVGRGANLAYAYFLYDREKRLTPTARKRLRTIYEATELGAGFNIALKDLEIRGAGTLLGARQSGHISAIGFHLYCRLLAEAVEVQKARMAGQREGGKKPRLPAPALDLPLSAFIPEGYVADLESRLGLYQKLSRADEPARVETLEQEFIDRFGPPPPAVRNLLYAVKLKLLAAQAGIESITAEHGQIVIRRFDGPPFDRRKLAPLLRDGIRVGSTQIALNPKRIGERWKEVLGEVVEKV